MDPYVAAAQGFVNRQYANGATLGIEPLEENGKTGWPVMRALTRALQYEMGISPLSDAFGPTTLSTLQSRYPKVNETTSPSANFTRIIQSALYCKGYKGGGDIDGVYDSEVKDSVTLLKTRMGVSGTFPGSSIEPKVFKALLTMDAYVVVGSGSSDVRAVQQWLNGRYVGRRDFFIMPCDGYHSRDVAKSMLFAIQYELGMADGTANGVFGPGTQSGLKGKTVATGSTGVWARLFTAAMILNKRSVTFGDFTASVETAVRAFQSFSKLPVTGQGDYATWASLLVSYGDQTRAGTACDGVTKITADRAKTLYDRGYRYVGRYLSGATGSTSLPEKPIQPGELDTIKQNGLRCFPIYQTTSRSVDYFRAMQGTNDAYMAIEWARVHGFKAGTTIYFAVDYDAVDGEVTTNILPHFKAIRDTLAASSQYKVGIYGPRNVCQRVYEAGYAITSFVCDMSSGFSGNLGYPLPDNWAFDQISTITIGSGTGQIQIDNNIASGRDTGQVDFAPSALSSGLDKRLNEASYGAQLLRDVQTYFESIGLPERGGDWSDPQPNGFPDDDWATWGGNSTTLAVQFVMAYDSLFTSLARDLKIRKALIQAPVVWEIRQWNYADWGTDVLVEQGQRDDSSTGPGQIFAWVTIEARNYCMQQGWLNGTPLVLSTDRRAVWDRLHTDVIYNISSVAYLTLYNGYQLDVAQGTAIGRPNLTTSHANIEKLLGRYNGDATDSAENKVIVEKYGKDLISLYDILEKYNLLSRS